MKTFAATDKKPLTNSQRRATESINRWVAVVAGAGSGKTRVLVERCINIIKDEPARLDRLLAITFTEKAAAQLLSRIRHYLPQKSHYLLAHAWVGTFHAICARILKNNAPLVNLDPSFLILDENAFHLLAVQTVRDHFIALLEKRDWAAIRLVEELDFKNAVSLLQTLLDFRWHARQCLKKSQGLSGRDAKLHEAAAYCYREVEHAVMEAMGRLGAIDFQELEIKTLDLLKGNPAVLAAYQKKFHHILVDEYQDTSDIQSELVFLLARPDVNTLAIVGDPRQSIYRFRGANVHCFYEAIKRIKKAGGEMIALDENFRSEPAIISATNFIFSNLWSVIGQERPAPLKPAREGVTGEPAVHLLLFEETKEKWNRGQARRTEARALASHILNLTQKGAFGFSDMACLFQAMTDVGEYELAFKEAGIPYRFFGGRGLLERPEIRDLMHALSYAFRPDDPVALLGLLRSPLIGLSDDDCAKLAGPEGRHLQQAALQDERTNLLRFLITAAKYLKPSEILERTIHLTGYDLVACALDPSGGMLANIERLISLSQSLEREEATTLSSFLPFLSELRKKSARLGDPPALGFGGKALSCMTVHTAKGLEFPVVIIPDLMRGVPTSRYPWRFLRQEGLGFKLRPTQTPFGERVETERFGQLEQRDAAEEQEEAKRLLYVAMTRARDLLVVPLHQTEKIRGSWHEWLLPLKNKSASPLTVVIPTEKYNNKPALLKPSGPPVLAAAKAAPHLKSKGRGLRSHPIFTVTELETFDRCPREYYLKYMLGLPPDEIWSEDKRTLPANVRGSIVHAVLQKYDPAQEMKLEDLIRTECFQAAVTPHEKIYRELKRPLANFAKSEWARYINEGRREVRFDLNLFGSVITGTIDWLKPASKGYEIIDFKTDQVLPQEVKKRAREYELQLVTYALAAQTSLKQTVVSTALYFLEPDVWYAAPLNLQRAKEGKNRIENIIQRIRQGDFTLGDRSPSCYRCPYLKSGRCPGQGKKKRDP